MNIDTQKLKEVLVRENYLSEDDYNATISAVEKDGTSIVDYLLAHDLMTKDLLGQALAESFGIPYADLNSNQPRAS